MGMGDTLKNTYRYARWIKTLGEDFWQKHLEEYLNSRCSPGFNLNVSGYSGYIDGYYKSNKLYISHLGKETGEDLYRELYFKFVDWEVDNGY